MKNKLLKELNKAYKDEFEKNYIRGEIYWLRLWISWMKSSKLKRFLLKKQILTLTNSLEEREYKICKFIKVSTPH